jgi:hypothetical protein
MDEGEQLMTDTDLDGLPDDYEMANGLNPDDATDGYRLTDSGYSNLELFLNGVADGTIDLTPYKTDKTAVENVTKNAAKSSGADFNLSGIRQSKARRGIVITGGRKYQRR